MYSHATKKEWKKRRCYHSRRALSHPSRVIAIGAAQLLAAGAGGRVSASLLENVLEQGEGFALQMLALIADSVWGKEASTKVLRRLNGPLSPGCGWLLRELPRLCKGQADEQIREVLVRSLAVDDPRIAIAAAETLQSLPDAFLDVDLSSVQAAFALWSTQGDYCENHQRYVRGSCCSRVPLCPRAEILKLLLRFSRLELHEWLGVCSDPHSDVRKVAIQGVVYTLTSQPEYISEVIRDMEEGHHPTTVLEAILSLPAEVLMPAKETLLALFSSESPVLRRVMIRNVAKAKWLTKEQAAHIAQVGLEDSDLTVRNLAVTALRLLRPIS